MKRFLFILIILAFICSPLFTQVQIGKDIPGIDPNDEFGSGLSISNNGDIVAIGIHRRNSERGMVEVYQYKDGEWRLMGNRISGEIDNQWFGTSVSLSADGRRLLVGCVYKNIAYVYDFKDGDWMNSSQIEFGSGLISFGRSVDLSIDGKTAAIAATHFPQANVHRGIVNIYKETTDSWMQIGEGIEGEFDKDQSGWDIDLSENGNMVAIGSISNRNNGEDAGQVRVFSFDGNGWKQRGNSLYGESEHLSFGWKIAMSENSKYLVVGAPIDWTGITTDYHYAKVYEFDSDIWKQKGDNIFGNINESFGYDVAISNDGNRIAVSVPQNMDCPIQIYDFKDTVWELVGAISHDAQYNTLGFSIAMNPHGKILVGTSRSPEGFAVVYSLDELTTPSCMEEDNNIEEEERDSIKIYFPNIIHINSNIPENAVFFGQSINDLHYRINIFDRWGNLLFQNNEATTNNISDGWSPGSNTIQGVYVYLIRYNNGEKESIIAGDITLIK